jgi:HK97 family phage prohead protease
MQKLQWLQTQAKDFEFSNEDGSRIFQGYASKFGNVDSYGDTVFPGAYAKTINPENRNRSIKMRWNHWGDVIGKWLELKEDEVGLWVKGELTPGHVTAENVYASLKHGAIDGLSIGYVPVKAEDNDTGGQDLYEIQLFEISVVEEPADIHATVGTIKDAIGQLGSIREIESFIRDECNLSAMAAKALISQVKSVHRDDDVTTLDCANLKINF